MRERQRGRESERMDGWMNGWMAEALRNLPGRMGSLGWLPTQADVVLVFSTLA